VTAAAAPFGELGAVLTLPGLARHAAAARSAARLLARTPEQADTAALLVSEMFTNSLLHTWSGWPGGRVTVAVAPARWPAGALRITVTDAGPMGPDEDSRAALPPGGLAPGDLAAEHGRGLVLIDRLSVLWGYGPAARGRWETWCVVPRELGELGAAA
jgi:anti-sigma regulatory factor (Ser/Thr protein kinase)